jgi:hypothetical protein
MPVTSYYATYSEGREVTIILQENTRNWDHKMRWKEAEIIHKNENLTRKFPKEFSFIQWGHLISHL